jgi:DNA adenine methylase
VRPVLRYHGGKWTLAPRVVRLMPTHRVYVEPFGGAASVLMRKPRAYAEVYNDRWNTVVNVFRVLRDPDKAEKLKLALELTPFARTEFESCGEVDLAQISDEIELARRTIFRSFAGFGSASTNSKYATGFRSNSHRSGTTPAHDWANYPSHIATFVERLRGVCIENRDAEQVIAQHDSPETLFYVDPPYVHSTRNMARGNAAYEFEMADEDHRRLASMLGSVQGMVMLSGYRCVLYDELYAGWKREELSHYADGAKKRTECIWFNRSAIPFPLLEEATA